MFKRGKNVSHFSLQFFKEQMSLHTKQTKQKTKKSYTTKQLPRQNQNQQQKTTSVRGVCVCVYVCLWWVIFLTLIFKWKP